MADGLNPRKVLIIQHDARTLETIRVLLGSFGYQCVFGSDERQALALLEQENPGIAILDPQSESFSRLILRLRGRVIVVANGGPELDHRVGLCSLPRIRRDRLVNELKSSLEALLWPHKALQRVTQVARLVFDSFRHPLPVGVRVSQGTERRLVYESGALSIDVSFELKMEPPVIQLVGQILDSTNPDRRLKGIPVVLQGQKGPIAMATTNEFGEFHVDFDVETNVIVEVEKGNNHWVTLVSPSLEWATKATGTGS